MWILLSLLLLFVGNSDAADPPNGFIRQIAQSQVRFQAPYNLLAVRWLPDFSPDGRYLIARQQNNPYGPVPSTVPSINIGRADSAPSKFIFEAAQRLISEYGAGRHKLAPKLAAKLKADIEAALATPDFRSVWYEMHSPFPPGSPERVSSTIRLFDATSFETARIAPLERWLEWTFPERENGVTALVELQFAFQNYATELAELAAFRHLLGEIATYLDMFYLSQGWPVVVRFLTTPRRAKLFQNSQYGFKLDESAPVRDTGLQVLRMDGINFVSRFGSRWPTWKHAYEMQSAPINPLLDPKPLLNAVKARLRKARSQYRATCNLVLQGHAVGLSASESPMTSIEQFPTLDAFIDGLFHPVFSSAETALLF